MLKSINPSIVATSVGISVSSSRVSGFSRDASLLSTGFIT